MELTEQFEIIIDIYLTQNRRKRKKRDERRIKLTEDKSTENKSQELIDPADEDEYVYKNPANVVQYMVGHPSWVNDIQFGSSPTPIHNFPQILEPWERNPEYYQTIREMNDILLKLQVGQGVMYEGRGYSDIKNTIKYRKFVSEKLKIYIQKLDNLLIVSAPDYAGGQSLETRDLLLNLGVAIFGSGLYLMMMSSHFAGDSISKAANYHLQKGIFLKKVTKTCISCGHVNCMECEGA